MNELQTQTMERKLNQELNGGMRRMIEWFYNIFHFIEQKVKKLNISLDG